MRFAKMQATGNDFVLVEADAERDWPHLARSMCDRRFGVGSDGLILLTPSQVADLGMRFLWYTPTAYCRLPHQVCHPQGISPGAHH